MFVAPEAREVNSTWKRNGLVYVLILIAVGALFYSARQSSAPAAEKDLTEVATLIEQGKVDKITVVGDQLEVQLLNDKPGKTYISHKETGVALTTALLKLGVPARQACASGHKGGYAERHRRVG